MSVTVTGQKRHLDLNGATLTTTGNITIGGDILVAESKAIKLGTGGTFQLWHQSGANGNSFIDEQSTGELFIRSNSTIRLAHYANNTYSATFNPAGAVELYHNTAKKFQTEAAGASVTGNFYLTSGNHVHFDNGVSNNYYLRKTGTTLEFKTGGSYNFLSGDATFSGRVGLNGTTPSDFNADADDLIVGSGSGDVGITMYSGSSVGDYGAIYFADGTTGSAEYKGIISYEQNNEIMRFHTNTTEALRLDLNQNATFAGNIGLGNATSPNRLLHIDNTSNTSKASAYFYTNGVHTGTTSQSHVAIWSDNASSTGTLIYGRGDGTGDLLILNKGGTNKLVVDDDGAATFASSVTATSFSGDGSNLTNLPAQAAPSNMVTTDTSQTISGDKTFTGSTIVGELVTTNHIYGRYVNNSFSQLYRFGGLFLTWDSDTYGTQLNHSITSTDNGTYSDSITINSYDKVRINIDSNNNDSASTFSIGKHGTGTSGTLLTLEEDGDLTITGNVTANGTVLTGATSLAGYATESYVDTAVSNLVDNAPANLNTLNELAEALNDDDDAIVTINTALGNRVRVDTASQGLTSTQKSNARTNIGAQASGNYLTSFDITTQTDSKYLRSDTADTATGKIVLEGNSAAWNTTTPGTTTGSLHFDPGATTDHFGSAITFGASDTGDGANAQAGIYTRSDGSYGTRMYFATTDSYASGSKVAMYINHNKDVYFKSNIVVDGTVDGVDIATRDGVLTSTTTTANAALPKAGGTMTGNLVMEDEMIDFANNGNATLPNFKGKRANTRLNDRDWDTEGGWSYTTFENNTTDRPSDGLHNGNGLLTFNTHSGDGTNNYMHQIAMTTNTNKLWHRRRSGASWGSWEEILKGSQTFASLTSKPTTISGYGITDAYTKTESDGKYLLNTTDTLSGNLTVTGNLTVQGINYGLYHAETPASNESGSSSNYYHDPYGGGRHLAMFLKNARADIIRYRAIDNVEYWNGSSWQDGSSQLANVKKLLDGRQDTMWAIPEAYYKFRFTISPSTPWPTTAKVGTQTSWTGSTYPGHRMIVEEYDGSAWGTRVTAKFGGSSTTVETTDNNCDNWGWNFISTNQLHTGNGTSSSYNSGQNTRITIDFYGWSPSNSSYVTIPMQNIFITSNFSGIENTDYTNLLDYDRNITTAGAINLGHASDTTIARSAAGKVTIEGNEIYHEGHKPTYSELGNMNYSNLTGTVPTWNQNTTGSAGSVPYSGVSSKPTFVVNAALSGRSTTAQDTAGDGRGVTFNYSGTTGNKPTGTDHSLMTMAYSNDWQTQLAQDWRNSGRMYLRGQNNGTWSSWNQVWDSSDFTKASVLNSNVTLASLGAQAAGNYLTAHPSISAANSVDNTGNTFIQDLTLDSNGHVTFVTSAGVAIPNHDDLSGWVAEKHIDWTVDNSGVYSIHSGNIPDLSGTYLTSLSGAVLTTTNQTIAGVKTFDGKTVHNDGIAVQDLNDTTITRHSSGHLQLPSNVRIFSDNYHPNADKLTTARTIAGTSFDGSANIDINYNNLINKPTIPTGDITQVSAGAGLTGGATSGNATLNLDVDGTNSYIHMNNTVTPTTGDFIPFHDTNGNVVRKTTISTLLGLGGTGSKSLSSSGNRYDVIPFVGSDGVMEVGRYIDFHTSDGSTSDFAHRLTVNGSTLSFSAGISGSSASFSSTVDMNSTARFNYSSGSRGSQFEAATTSLQTLRCDSDRFRFWLGSERLTITDTGRVGINDSTPDYTLDVSGNVSGISIYASHDIAAYSDKRVKKDIETIEDALQKVNKLRGVTFKRKDGKSDKVHMGVIAQEVQEVIPEVVTAKESDGHLSVSYGNMVGVLIEAVKELTAEVEELKSKLNDV